MSAVISSSLPRVDLNNSVTAADERDTHIQKLLDFPLTVYGIERGEATTGKITHRLAENLHSHASDEVMMYGV
jgi:hypothetical protein